MEIKYRLYNLKTGFAGFCNYTYIVVDKATQDAFIVDPAWELNKITDELNRVNARLRAILLTHSHFDHVNLVNPLVKQFNADVYISQAEIDYYKFSCNNLIALNDCDRLSIGNINISCLLTPGHTIGGMCYLLEDCMFTGDTIFSEGCGICNTRGGSAEQMYESVQRIKSDVHPFVRIYPGHSYGQAPGKALMHVINDNIYFQIRDKEAFVNFRMRNNIKW